MAYEQRDGDISVFFSQGKTGNQPDWKGTALIDGKKRSVSLWIKQSNTGEFLAGKIQDFRNPGDARETHPAKPQNPPRPQAGSSKTRQEEFADEIPF